MKQQTITLSAEKVVMSYMEALGSGMENWHEHLSDNVAFIGPIDQTKGKDAYVQLTSQFFPMVKEYKPMKLFGNETWVTQEGIYSVNTPNGGIVDLECAEVFEISEGKISKIRIYYDPTEFKNAFGLN